MKPNIGLEAKDSQLISDLLNRLLSDEYLLYTKTRKYHWNVTGPRFDHLHSFFEKQYDDLEEAVDEVAERVRMLGGTPLGTLREFVEHGRLEEAPGRNPAAAAMIQDLLKDHETVIRQLRADLETCAKRGDAGTGDFLTGLMERHEKSAWMLRASLGE